MHAIDLVRRVFCELAITHKGENLSISLIVDTENDWVIIDLGLPLEQLVRTQILHVKLTFLKRHLKTHFRLNPHLLNVVIFVWSVHHNRNIIPILLFSDTCIDPQRAIT